jgi:drug/metabolite transporter (DMT)-like permease
MKAEVAGGTRPGLARLVFAFACVYVIWGSTYLAIRLAIDTLPPLAMAGARFLTAGGLMYAFLRLRGEARPPLRHWRSGAVVGVLLLVGGNTAVVYAEKTVPSGIVALLVAMVPLWMVLLEWLRPGGGVRPTVRTFLGLAVGLVGMVMLVGPESFVGGRGGVSLAGAGIVIVGSMSWAFGSIYARHAELPRNPMMTTAMEMSSAGVVLALGSLLTGELGSIQWSQVSGRSVLALAYLIVFGSLVAFSAYVWLLRASTPALVSTYAYVNPVVAVFLGWLVLSEPITTRMLVAAAVIIAAVVIITTGRRPDDAATKSADASPAGGPERAGDARHAAGGKTERGKAKAGRGHWRSRSRLGGGE